MLELMTWSEIIESLQREGNLKMAAIFDEKCEQLAGTDGAMLGSEDAYSITRIMGNAPSTMIYGLFLGGNKFQCLTVDHNTLIGQAGGDVFVALRSRKLLICAVAGLSSTVSCLGIVRNFVGRLVAEGAPEASVPSLEVAHLRSRRSQLHRVLFGNCSKLRWSSGGGRRTRSVGPEPDVTLKVIYLQYIVGQRMLLKA
ncbi:hypothetical protein EGW08_022937 [Elysia chlorotica]|uniref:Profilin n=1 Tax=Elysia chlorotica TaxID=188477 RepID=A0A433SJM9_ELYCH|nr:hypothetical protein EGW08_022937 [Elysia chlorotica]